MSLLDLLRDPERALSASRDPRQQASFARSCLVAIAIGGALFGATVGSFRGGPQVGFAALKIPVATLLTMAVAGPALFALAAAFGRRWTLPSALAVMLGAGARSSLVLGALSPVLWLAIDLGVGYGSVKLAATAAYGAAGLSGLTLLLRGLGREAGRLGAASCFVMVFLVTGAQTAWVLRPYLGDPHDTTVPLLVNDRVEGGVVGSLRGRRWTR
jgi:hypothetical protein